MIQVQWGSMSRKLSNSPETEYAHAHGYSRRVSERLAKPAKGSQEASAETSLFGGGMLPPSPPGGNVLGMFDGEDPESWIDRQLKRITGLAIMADRQRHTPPSHLSSIAALNWGMRWGLVIETLLVARWFLVVAKNSRHRATLKKAAELAIKKASFRAASIHRQYPRIVEEEQPVEITVT